MKNTENTENIVKQLIESIREEENARISKPEIIEMLSIPQCCQVIQGVSQSTIRLLTKTGKLPFIRTGRGEHGKILIKKTDLLAYFGG
ncbi:MAG: helix-turn-helix domain-containing protein [Huintestinicola sp.]